MKKLKFKLNTPIAGSRYSYVAGDEIPVTKTEGDRYKAAGMGQYTGVWTDPVDDQTDTSSAKGTKTKAPGKKTATAPKSKGTSATSVETEKGSGAVK